MRDIQTRARSLPGFYERELEDLERLRRKRKRYMDSARSAKARGEKPHVISNWLFWAKKPHRQILEKLKYLPALKRQADKLKSAADLEHSLEHQEAAE